MASAVRWLNTYSSGRATEFGYVLALAFIQGTLWSMLVPVIPLLARSLGASEMMIGVISIMPAVLAIFLSIPGSTMCIRYGKRLVIIWNQALGLLASLLLIVANNLGLLVAPQMILGISNMLFWPTYIAYLTDLIPSQARARVLGLAMAISSIGMIFGPVTAGALSDWWGFRAVFFLYAIISVAGILLARRLPQGNTNRDVSAMRALTEGLHGAGALLKRDMLKITTLLGLLQFINVGGTEYFNPVLLKDMGYSTTFVGSVVTMRTAGLTLVRFGLGSMVARFGVVPLLFAGVATCAVLMGLLPFIPGVAYAAASHFVAGMAFGMVPVLVSTLIAENTSPEERTLGMAIDSTVVNTARMVSGLALGGLAQSFGLPVALAGGNLFVLCGLTAVLVLYLRMPKTRH